jgi:hypothetical protein
MRLHPSCIHEVTFAVAYARTESLIPWSVRVLSLGIGASYGS